MLNSIQKTNPSVSFILRACQPQGMHSSQLTLVFKYKFHQDQIERPEIKSLIIELLQKIYGQAIAINTILNKDLEINNAPNAQKQTTQQPAQESINKEEIPRKPIEQNSGNNDMMSNIINTFGGRVIN